MTDETEDQGARFVIDAGRSRLTAQAFAGGLLSFAGHDPVFAVRRFGGEVQFAAGKRTVESMLVVVRSESLRLLDDVSEKDRREIEETMRREVLETDGFPEIFFVSKDVSLSAQSNGSFLVTAQGALSIHGETRPQTITAEATIADELLRARGEFRLKQSDFKIERVTALGGTLKVRDEVRIAFEIAAAV